MSFSTSGVVFLFIYSSCNFSQIRDCRENNLVRDFATFHIILDLEHIPETVPQHQSLLDQVLVCKIYNDRMTHYLYY